MRVERRLVEIIGMRYAQINTNHGNRIVFPND